MKLRKPEWLKIKLSGGKEYVQLKELVERQKVHTICTSGKCPNIGECWSKGAATFMIGGDICTRSCKFCATKTGKPLPLSPQEPNAIAESVQSMNLRHAVITSVDRDDLPDGGAQHWHDTIRAIREKNPNVIIEVLIPDFQGNTSHLDIVIDAKPNIISHNIETVKRITPLLRTKAKYDVSLAVLKHISESGIMTKSGLMVGVGETKEEILETIKDLYDNGCRMITIGQYLQPTNDNIDVQRYVHPDEFAEYKNYALEIGFTQAESGPLVRSSYMAENSFENIKDKL
mgnify:CR=1 FL=1|jgi:lipoic acid synthetase